MLQRRVVGPVADLLRVGATPEKIAWSLAVGFAIGVNPLLGSTTLLALAVAWVFRLNLVASQVANHLAYPLEVLLFAVFVKLGARCFHTPALPLGNGMFVRAIKTHPWDTTRALWSWEWHALVVWFVCAAVAVPVLAEVLKRGLRRMVRKEVMSGN